MGSFYTVTSGNITASADINQYANILNGSVSGQVAVKNASSPLAAYLASAPSSDTTDAGAGVSGDAVHRVSLYIRGADGYGGVRGGTGSALTAHLYAQSGGWRIDESLTIGTNLTVQGSTTVASVSASGSVSAGSVYDSGQRVAVTGPYSSAGQPKLSIGSGAPITLSTNEVYFQLS